MTTTKRLQKKTGLVSATLAVCVLLLSGCSNFTDFMSAGAGATVGIMGAGMAMDAMGELLFKGIEGVDKGQSMVSMLPTASAELAKAKKVAVQIGGQDEIRVQAAMGSESVVLDDALSGYLMRMGYEVASKEAIGGDSMQEMMREAMQYGQTMQPTVAGQKPQAPPAGQEVKTKTAKLREKGIDILIGGSIATSTGINTGPMNLFFGRSEMQMRDLVNSASVRVTNCADDRLLLTAVVAYKKGKTAQQVAGDLAGILMRARSGVAQ